MRRLQIAAVALIVTTGCALHPGTRSEQRDWARVASLHAETDLIVQHVDPRDPRGELMTVRGRLIAAGPSELTVRTGNGEARLGRGAVRRVALVLADWGSREKASLVGAAIGAVLGLSLTARPPADWEPGAGEGIRVTTTAAGAAAGAWADTLRDARRTRLIYRRD